MAKTTLPALNSNNRASWLDDVQLQCIAQTEADTVVDLYIEPVSTRAAKGVPILETHVRLPLVRLDAPRLGIPEWVAAPVEVDLTGGLLVTSD